MEKGRKEDERVVCVKYKRYLNVKGPVLSIVSREKNDWLFFTF